MWMKAVVAAIVAVGMLGGVAGCGAPREAGALAREEAALLSAVLGDDAGVKRALEAQADAWTKLAGMMGEKALGGVAVEGEFAALVEETAALARRQKALIDAGSDDAAGDRAVLEKLRAMWGEVGEYLGD